MSVPRSSSSQSSARASAPLFNPHRTSPSHAASTSSFARRASAPPAATPTLAFAPEPMSPCSPTVPQSPTRFFACVFKSSPVPSQLATATQTDNTLSLSHSGGKPVATIDAESSEEMQQELTLRRDIISILNIWEVRQLFVPTECSEPSRALYQTPRELTSNEQALLIPAVKAVLRDNFKDWTAEQLGELLELSCRHRILTAALVVLRHELAPNLDNKLLCSCFITVSDSTDSSGDAVRTTVRHNFQSAIAKPLTPVFTLPALSPIAVPDVPARIHSFNEEVVTAILQDPRLVVKIPLNLLEDVLLYAAQTECIGIVKAYVTSACRTNLSGDKWIQAYNKAWCYGHDELIATMLQESQVFSVIPLQELRSTLLNAAQKGRTRIVEAFVNSPLCITLSQTVWTQAGRYAKQFGHTKIAELVYAASTRTRSREELLDQIRRAQTIAVSTIIST